MRLSLRESSSLRSSGNLTASPQVHFARRNRIARQAVRQVTDRLSKHRSQSYACAHATSCDRFAAQSLRSFGQPDAFGASASFAPTPAPVKLAEPKYALRPSTMIHLKCTRGQSIRSIPRHRSGYRSKSSRQFGSASCDRYAAQSLRSLGQPDAFGAGQSGSFA